MDLHTIRRRTRETIRYFPGDLSLPERIVLLDGSGSISFDVCRGSPIKKSVSFALIGKVPLSASLAHRVIQPILFA
jgi:hypothetical protein